ncbi:helix-turn-helix domain-containing protein [Azospirillum brasilense]|uniref:Helix-turn-helix domain-containing protein n=1 Tax=Azospirillum brasilense TaxID=192 RepID=A0A4D8QN26_AZOBR|nr:MULTISPECIES: helix-turn-helix domain-containing protein [Azospirillum]MDW7551575.1 helix-turn-helix domain-containing protein [Azospirillum brasilense]MDW7591010.1 helix-turn-helix domain-containing protein [Azospirillum brasilense]MDW7632714.1 helix-turn-helix domain-containing protein [Azospirillum brasilense]MDX5951472.1 helix-turn-helix domain-containing protein [Azospirillum brasilense]OPH15764.1 hypothetical protein FE89_08000 [Azospirillum brasilense]
MPTKTPGAPAGPKHLHDRPMDRKSKEALWKRFLDVAKPTPAERHVLSMLMFHYHSNETGQCNPSQETVAEITGYTEKFVSRTLTAYRWFVRSHRMPTVAGKGGGNRYNFAPESDWPNTALARQSRPRTSPTNPTGRLACDDPINATGRGGTNPIGGGDQPHRPVGSRSKEEGRKNESSDEDSSGEAPAARATSPGGFAPGDGKVSRPEEGKGNPPASKDGNHPAGPNLSAAAPHPASLSLAPPAPARPDLQQFVASLAGLPADHPAAPKRDFLAGVLNLHNTDLVNQDAWHNKINEFGTDKFYEAARMIA